MLTGLYPESAHFIYELLQNAEDQGAQTVRFTLNPDCLHFEHDAPRLFDLRDVEGITSIGDSWKVDQPTQIGKFGVGFKAVFSYTRTPAIHSGPYRFRIRDLVVPELLTDVPSFNVLPTFFSFPFDHETNPAVRAVDEISRGLRAIDDSSLLFLSSIKKIEYILPDGSRGSVCRFEVDGVTQIVILSPGEPRRWRHWLRFKREVTIDEDGETKPCIIGLAFAMSQAGEDEEGSQLPLEVNWRLVPVDPGRVFVYFPAVKETSNLRFHVHAPFASTVARDSVRDTSGNRALRDAIGTLLVESLEDVRARRLLTVEFLECLPLAEDSLPPLYQPLRSALISAFRERDLTPTKAGGHAPAQGLYRGPAEIVGVLSDEDLRLLVPETVGRRWAANPPQRNQRADKYLASLQIPEWGWKELHTAFSGFSFNADRCARIENWMTRKPDDYLLRVNALLGEAIARVGPIRWFPQTPRLIRAVRNRKTRHVTPDRAFFPPETENPGEVPIVKEATYAGGRSEVRQANARRFLESVGVREYNEQALVADLLRRYSGKSRPKVADHRRHVPRIVAFWRRHPEEAKRMLTQGTAFLLGESLQKKGDSLFWCQPDRLCLDEPFEQTDLAALVPPLRPYLLWSGYGELGLPDFGKFAVDVGVMDRLKVVPASCSMNPLSHQLCEDARRDGVRVRGETAINEDYAVEGLTGLLRNPSLALARAILRMLRTVRIESATARYRPSRQHKIRVAPSQFVQELAEASWLPDNAGGFGRPREMSAATLHTEIDIDDMERILAAVGFGSEELAAKEQSKAKDAQAVELGFQTASVACAIAEAFRESGLDPAVAAELLRSQRRRQELPGEPVADPERRRQGVRVSRENRPLRESVLKERSAQPGLDRVSAEARAYLRAKYTNGAGTLICQLCQGEMPFRLATGEHYFEAVQCIRGLDRHYFENRLALCPVCAAKYQHTRVTTDDQVRQSLIDTPDGGDGPGITLEVVLLEGACRIYIVAKHAIDLRAVLEAPLDEGLLRGQEELGD